jgi:nitroimidazol reductase NimA-like FMN-containing flavoprotein (pyridoxamine 5'-phosphate oxidase superfamily)
MGRIAFVVDSLPLVLPVNYRSLNGDTGRWILLRTRPGNAIDSAPREVAFEIDGTDDVRHQGWSVLVSGVLHHLDHNEIELMKRRFDPKPWPQDDRSSWLAIKPRTITGRRLRAPASEWHFSARAYL